MHITQFLFFRVQHKTYRKVPYCEDVKLLTNILSVDYYIALPFISDTGDYYSFTSANKLVSWLGLAPRDYQKGDRTYKGRIIKEGTPRLR